MPFFSLHRATLPLPALCSPPISPCTRCSQKEQKTQGPASQQLLLFPATTEERRTQINYIDICIPLYSLMHVVFCVGVCALWRVAAGGREGQGQGQGGSGQGVRGAAAADGAAKASREQRGQAATERRQREWDARMLCHAHATSSVRARSVGSRAAPVRAAVDGWRTERRAAPPATNKACARHTQHRITHARSAAMRLDTA
jgi:hypothetical protein